MAESRASGAWQNAKVGTISKNELNSTERSCCKMGMLPKISVVVPSFNQAKYLELTLRCILEQNYPELELIVIDGGSKDESPAIIRKYEKHIKFWCSEPDGGQTQGLIKGFSHATGGIQCVLDSDDLFGGGVLFEV